MISPCTKCNKRFVGCHAQCADYAAFVVEVKKRREKRFNAHKAENDYYSSKERVRTSYRRNKREV